jgi:superfamily II DNA helicase RecQ
LSPAVFSKASEKGFTLVVSPLISLMEDQVMALTRANVPAAMLNASSTKEQVNKIQAVSKGLFTRTMKTLSRDTQRL